MQRSVLIGSGGGIRTPEWWDQNPLPYHLATPEYEFDFLVYVSGLQVLFVNSEIYTAGATKYIFISDVF